MRSSIYIDSFQIGTDQPCFIIAEAGVNHNGDLQLALELVDQAKAAGADCVKFQTFKAESVVTAKAPKANYQLEVTDKMESQLTMLKKLELSKSDYIEITNRCAEQNIMFLSTPYNEDDAGFLNDLGVGAFKIASGQLVEHSFLQHVASFGKPMILSTGMATLAEVYDAVQVLLSVNFDQIIILQCTTNYPSKLEDSNIRAMTSMGKALDVLMGYSDHVPNNYACYAAVAHGATVIEKHFTLDKKMDGPDHSSSLNPEEFCELVKGVRAIELSLGSAVKSPSAAEIANTEGMRRSIVLVNSRKHGDVIRKEDIEFKRPATGIPPKYLNRVLGKKLTRDVSKDEILMPEMISNLEIVL